MSILVRSASLTLYDVVARRAGLDPARMLREFGLPVRCLEDPDIKVPVEAVRQLLEASAQRSGVEAFGLLMAEARRLSHLGPLGLLIREQPTLRLAIEALVRYGRQLNEALFLTVEETGQVVVLREEVIAEIAREPVQIATGMMYRTNMTENTAMLFVFSAPGPKNFYMRNCIVPLSAAYIEPDGTIAEIVDLQPGDEVGVQSRTSVLSDSKPVVWAAI